MAPWLDASCTRAPSCSLRPTWWARNPHLPQRRQFVREQIISLMISLINLNKDFDPPTPQLLTESPGQRTT